MTINFRILATLTAIVCFSLAAAWLFVPYLLPLVWGVSYSYPVGLVGRRGAALFLGIGVMFLMARNAEESQARTALVRGFSIACIALAASGLYELAAGHAGVGILSAALVELSLAVAFLAVTRTGKAKLAAGA
jgi:hypothetical protein